MRNTLVFLTLASIVSRSVQMFMTYAYAVAKRCFKFMKQTNMALIFLPTVALLTVWMLLVVIAAVMFAQRIVQAPCAKNCSIIAGPRHTEGIKMHIDSGASRHFFSQT